MASTVTQRTMTAIELACCIKTLAESMILKLEVANYMPEADREQFAEQALEMVLNFIDKHRPKVEHVMAAAETLPPRNAVHRQANETSTVTIKASKVIVDAPEIVITSYGKQTGFKFGIRINDE
ncbi:hypothetical protein [Yokenella regensburgei]|uniref:hypothetical protein n=1 Tax=Yokenella regensburgei TaxID=158877 RepID=UPI00137635C8|nr:hypothetical protein [Yokenella regensburgei]KAF1366784.1 hypothetical protein FHR25_004749 [Yokenella regensburgei]